MKKYKVKTILHSGTSEHFNEYILEKIVSFNYNPDGCYVFMNDDNKHFYFPIASSIVIEL